jgi:hypothetical protein
MRLTTTKFSLRRNRKLRLADPRARPQPRPRKAVFASPDPRTRPQPRPRKVVSASPDLRARPREKSPPRPTLGSDRPRHGGYIITLPLASSGYGERDRRSIWLAPVTSNDGSPCASMTMVVLSPYGSRETSARSQQHQQLYFYRAQALLRWPRYRLRRAQALLRRPRYRLRRAQALLLQPRWHVHRAPAPLCRTR